jgi:hypothetical protein
MPSEPNHRESRPPESFSIIRAKTLQYPFADYPTFQIVGWPILTRERIDDS